jgi:hypothetical protein
MHVDMESSDLAFDANDPRLALTPLGKILLTIRVCDKKWGDAEAVLERRTMSAKLF